MVETPPPTAGTTIVALSVKISASDKSALIDFLIVFFIGTSLFLMIFWLVAIL